MLFAGNIEYTDEVVYMAFKNQKDFPINISAVCAKIFSDIGPSMSYCN